MQCKTIELSHGWDGWKFGPWGRARAWRLFDPDGAFYLPDEVRELHSINLDVDFLRARVRELEALVAAQSAYFNMHELVTLHRAASILARLPGVRLRRVA